MSTLQSVLPQSLMVLLTMLPAMLLYILGLSLCLTRRRQLGNASTYGALGFGLLLLSAALSVATQVWTFMMMGNYESAASLGMRLGVMSIANTVLSLTGVTLLLAAILARRPAANA